MPPMRTQSAAGQTSLAPHDSKARLISVTTRRRFMAKPCTPHPHCAARAFIQAANGQCWGSRGAPLVLSLGGVRGIFSFEKENIPLSRVPHTVWGIIECALRAQKKKHPFRCVQLRKHSKAREKRYSFGYAVSFIFACYQILWTFPKSLYLCSRYLPLVCG